MGSSISSSYFIQKDFTVGIQKKSDKKYSKKFDPKEFTDSIYGKYSRRTLSGHGKINHRRYLKEITVGIQKDLTEDFRKGFGRYSKRIDIATQKEFTGAVQKESTESI